MKNMFLVWSLSLFTAVALSAFEYEDPADFPLMGDWKGQWDNPKRGHEKDHPGIAAQLLPVAGGKYRVVILPELYNRAEPYLTVEVPASHEKVVVKEKGFKVVFEGAKASGEGRLHGVMTRFDLEKVPFQSPTMGAKPPVGARVLFDGSGFGAWEHEDGRAVTWKQVGDVMQVVTRHDKKSSVEGIGGDIITKESFGSLRFHMEFRYPVEAGLEGQRRGNSGLSFLPMAELQILNSYTTPNYWNECGSFYKRVPAKLDAAGPPLAWQTYDVELDIEESGTAIITVLLNGKIVHNKTSMECEADKVFVWLQDHINPMQFRNVWLLEK